MAVPTIAGPRLRRPRALGARVLAAGLLLCTGAAAPGADRAGRAALSRPDGIATLLARSTLLGRVDAAQPIPLDLGLRGRDPRGLDMLLASGRHISSAEYAARFGPDPAAARAAVAALDAAGLRARWADGSTLITVDARADAVERVLGVHLDSWRGPDGRVFHAADRVPVLPAAVRRIVTSVDGLDDDAVRRPQAIRSGSNGVSPDDVLRFYDISALRDAGLDGTGQTVMFPDSAPLDGDLKAYAAKFHLPPFDYALRGTQFSGPSDSAGVEETALDMEIVHAMAPKAKLLVYVQDPSIRTSQDVVTDGNRVNDEMVRDNAGSIISESYAWCEAEWRGAGAQQFDDIARRAAAQGITLLVASGDEGAYGCTRDDGHQTRVALEMPASDPFVTSVGGTTVFLSKQGTYGRETAWGQPIEQEGSVGGLSQIFSRPDYQAQAAIDSNDPHPMRAVPDVAALGDGLSGWDFFAGGKEVTNAGTSAACPLWAGVMALIDQDLHAKGLRAAGYANPAIYFMGAHNADYPGHPFHDITEGNNFLYDAGPGWDYTTGWGTPNAGALASAWEDYIRKGGA